MLETVLTHRGRLRHVLWTIRSCCHQRGPDSHKSFPLNICLLSCLIFFKRDIIYVFTLFLIWLNHFPSRKDAFSGSFAVLQFPGESCDSTHTEHYPVVCHRADLVGENSRTDSNNIWISNDKVLQNNILPRINSSVYKSFKCLPCYPCGVDLKRAFALVREVIKLWHFKHFFFFYKLWSLTSNNFAEEWWTIIRRNNGL